MPSLCLLEWNKTHMCKCVKEGTKK